MPRYLVAFHGVESDEWLFVAITAHLDDAVLVAQQWHSSAVFDTKHLMPPYYSSCPT